jgi:hypothetical protein
VSLSARLAIESPWITTDVINMAVLPYLAVRHQADDTPTTVVNGRKTCVGALAEDEFVRRIVLHGRLDGPQAPIGGSEAPRGTRGAPRPPNGLINSRARRRRPAGRRRL